MIKDLDLLNFNNDKFHTKKKIVHLLSLEWPLTAKSVYNRLKRYYNVNISYQAVFKLLKELEKEDVLVCKNLHYMLNVEWLKQIKKSLEVVEKNYVKGKKILIQEPFDKPIKLEFDNFTDLCVATAELLYSKQLSKDSNDNSFVCVLEYGWWSFKFRFEHLELLRKMLIVNPNAKNIIRKKTKFGKWIRDQYSKIGGISAPLGTNFDIDEDIFIQGNFIIEIKFDDNSRKMIESYYNKWSNVEDAYSDLALKEEPKIKATMTITRNPEIAKLLKKEIEKVFT